jgi:GT2 family glycosyltransferase
LGDVPTLSVLVVTYNERALVERCLPPLVAQLSEGDELIVADNASTDGTLAAVEHVAPLAKVIRMPANEGYMPACNAAAAQASGDILITLDADVIPAAGFCDAIRRPAAEARGWAAWMGLVTMSDGRLVNTSGGVSHFTGISWSGQLAQPVDSAPREPREAAFASGACLAMTREAWERDPGFAPEYFLYFDDVDWCFRARLRGGRLGLEPAARVDHLYDFTKRRVKWRLLERNRWATIIRTYPGELLLLVMPALLASELALPLVAARGGWLREKLEADIDVLRRLPRLLRERKAIQAQRVISAAEFADHLTADLSSPIFGRVGRSHVVRAAMRCYWSLVRRLLEPTRRSPLPPRSPLP